MGLIDDIGEEEVQMGLIDDIGEEEGPDETNGRCYYFLMKNGR
jgi:hypothetical protein